MDARWQVHSGPLRTAPQSDSTARTHATLAVAPGSHNDVNADGRSDVFWVRSAVSVQAVAHWMMNGASVIGTTSPSQPPAGTNGVWKGDLDGDRRTDQLWFDSSAGKRSLIWARQVDGGVQPTHIATIGDGWLPGEIVDLNGDGKSDIVWIDRTRGLIAYWLMNGATVSGSRVYTYDRANFMLNASGDFDGDGRGDLLWTGGAGGPHVYLWRGRADGNFDQVYVGSIDYDWELEWTSDLNGDGRTDLIWTNRDNLVAYWWMNGASVQGRGTLPADLGNYEIAATGDFDGDGKGDILWTTQDRDEQALLFLWRGRGDGRFDASYVAAYNRSTWLSLPDRYPKR
ncbi:FG-GAP-like repeat-containing protein [Lysobacter sp. 5GHs7-4]|uniref:FG-GAP-like repeat-containing protein n=1 Tax=Lysobacter sp. 5GHs7-4 TaxID=2904253 RepID=UPI001E438135|nr:FG-GAP-like repeat-containing protein [Lysobacter sp. 5GHs7-4]UHQ22673.1 FG-GAP-like repeat-containing protein [Lysobacter sp. 5GHs7-4]